MEEKELVHVHSEIGKVKERIENIERETREVHTAVDDIKDNHLKSIWAYMGFLEKSVGNLRWYIIGSVALLGVVLAILEVKGG